MVLNTLTSAGQQYELHEASTQQELIDALDGTPVHKVASVFHDGTNYIAVLNK